MCKQTKVNFSNIFLWRNLKINLITSRRIKSTKSIFYTLYSSCTQICTFYTLHFTVYTPKFMFHPLHFTVYTPKFMFHTLQCTLYTPKFTFYTHVATHATLYSIKSSHSTAHYTLYFTLYTLAVVLQLCYIYFYVF